MESRRSQELKNYQKALRKLLNENLIDVIIFGSFVKGGFAKDMDLALVINGNVDLALIKAKIKETVKNADINTFDIRGIYSPLLLTLIKEGFSIKENKFLYEIYHIEPKVLYKYSLNKLNNVQKVQFERGIKKMLGAEGIYLTRSVILIPITKKNEAIEFFQNWGIYYESQEYELVPFLRKEENL